MHRLMKLTVALAVVALVATACPGSDGDTNGDGGGAGDSVLGRVRDRGQLVCGVNGTVPGFGLVDEGGNYSGFDVDFCKAVAAAVFGDPSKVQFRALEAAQRFTALQAGEVDVLIRNTTWTASRDGTEGADFAHVNFYDGQGMMVKTNAGIDSLEDLDGERICVLSGTTTELNLETVFRARGIDYDAQSLQNTDQIQEAFIRDRCVGWTSDRSQLAGFKSTWPNNRGGPNAVTILDEVMSKEPLAPAVREGDDDWFDVVNWTVLATIQAEELGITSDNVEEMRNSDNPEVQRFLGQAKVTTSPSPGATGSPTTRNFNPGLGLADDWVVNVIEAVGNYGQIYRRNVGAGSRLRLDRGLNRLWTEGGLMYAPPYR